MEFLWQKKNYNFDTSLNEQFPEMEEDFNFRKSRCHELYKKMKKIYIPIAQEFIVYDQPNGICGTIDAIMYNTKKEVFSIIDWKTSKKFDTGNQWSNYMKEPFGHIIDCNTSHYSLQLSLYKYILEKYTSIKIGELVLFQIPGKEIPMPQVYRCFDFSSQIAKYFEDKNKGQIG
ncbi:MAG: PD-(D/E)XK nuclease family protein [Methanobrevibacter sp.]|nr:PD-(D/E)XK nuclease family protein [Methanobrevibacter sp.]